MPCPFFEPTRPARIPTHPSARLPLIEEYDGLCHASSSVAAVPEEMRFRLCNHGYSGGECARADVSSAMRYQVLNSAGTSRLSLLCVEEVHHTPERVRTLEFRFEDESILPADIDPPLRAQALAYCRSYIRRFL